MIRRLFASAMVLVFTIVLQVALPLGASASSDSQARIVLDTNTGFNVPPTWQKISVYNYDTDIDASIIKDAYKTSKGAIVFITYERFGKAYSADLLRQAVVTAWGSDAIVSVSASKVATLGTNQCAMVTLASPGGNGVQLMRGQSPTSRMIILVPNGSNVVQFIATAPASVFAPAMEDVKAGIENGLAFTASTVVEGKTALTPVEQLIKAGIDVYERKGSQNQPLMIISGDRILKALVVEPDNQAVSDTALSWRVEKAKVDGLDFVLLLKGSGVIGWLVPIPTYLENSQPKDGVARLAASTNLEWMNGDYINFKKVIQSAK